MTTALTIHQGDDEVLDITVQKPDGTPQDLTGCKLWFYVKASIKDTDADALIKKTTLPGEGITVTDAVNGIAEISIANADTSGFADINLGRELPWGLQALDGSDKITTLANGVITVTKDLILATS